MLVNRQMQERWLDKVWLLLLGDGDELMSPGRIRREGLNRVRVRHAELAAIVASERELAALRSGTKVRDHSGRVVDAIAVGDVPMYSVIERPPADEDAIFARLSRPQHLHSSVAGEVGARDLQRSLNIRRIALLAEQVVLTSSALRPLPARAPGVHWLQRWRQLAQDIYAAPLQRLWARLLVREVAAPGHYSLTTLDALANLGEDDVAGMQLLSGYCFGEFLFDARGRYFRPELHGRWLQAGAALGVLTALEGPHWLTLQVKPGGAEPLLLICHNRALQLSNLGAGVRVPVLPVTTVGKQLLGLCGGEADLAYLLDLAAYLRAAGVQVALGEWESSRRHFEKKFDVPAPAVE